MWPVPAPTGATRPGPLPIGDTVHIRFDGTHSTITKDGGDWESPFDGRFEFVGGTGKYENIKGRCHYVGKATAEGSMWDAVVDVQY